jgi:hypothetical protein
MREHSELKAELERARPLIEAVMTGEVYRNDETGEATDYTSEGFGVVEKAALAYRARQDAK